MEAERRVKRHFIFTFASAVGPIPAVYDSVTKVLHGVRRIRYPFEVRLSCTRW